MNEAKIQLSTEELQLVQNAQWLLTKNIIIEKVTHLFGELATMQSRWIMDHPHLLPEEVLKLSPKISKGEKYKGLPYVMLDYPRCFGKEDIFAIRTFFWWGNYFSVTLHLKGKFQQLFVPVLQKKLPELATAGFQLFISGDEWEHNLTEEGAVPPGNLSNSQITAEFAQAAFFKLTCPVSFSRWKEMSKVLFGLQKNIFNAVAG